MACDCNYLGNSDNIGYSLKNWADWYNQAGISEARRQLNSDVWCTQIPEDIKLH